jgi:2',3'-cyclic-nucleotide 2'-phosphodiesterase (5'-nucleotidase family)
MAGVVLKMRRLLPLALTLGLALAAQTPAAPHLNQGGNLPVTAAIPDDPELARVIAPLAAQIRASFGRVIATAPDGMARWAGPGEFPLGFLLADVMRAGAARAVGGEVRLAFTNNGGIRRDLPVGPVHVGDLYEVMPFDNELVVADYTGAEVLAIVKEAIQRRGGEPISGIRVALTGTPQQPVLAVTWADGSAFDPAGTYRVATSDYLLANGDATPSLKKGRNVVLTSIPVRQLLIDWCEAQGKASQPIRAPEGGRYTFAPEIAAAIGARTFHY